jgi:lipoate-protein ligase A
VVGGIVCGASVSKELAWIDGVLCGGVAEPLVRVWAYAAPAVVLGCSARVSAEMGARARAAGVELCVRQSGGGAVLTGPWVLGATVLLPSRHPLVVPSIPQSYRWFGLVHSAWLHNMGIVGARAVRQPQLEDRNLAWACFARVSHWEVEVSGRKIVGLAQARRRSGVLLSSAALIAAPPWQLLCDVLEVSHAHAAILAERTLSCAQITARCPAAEALARPLLTRLLRAVHAAGHRTCPRTDAHERTGAPDRTGSAG